MVWHPVIVVVIDAVVGLHIHGLALYPSRVHGKWIVIVHSCGIILLVVVTTTNMAVRKSESNPEVPTKNRSDKGVRLTPDVINRIRRTITIK